MYSNPRQPTHDCLLSSPPTPLPPRTGPPPESSWPRCRAPPANQAQLLHPHFPSRSLVSKTLNCSSRGRGGGKVGVGDARVGPALHGGPRQEADVGPAVHLPHLPERCVDKGHMTPCRCERRDLRLTLLLLGAEQTPEPDVERVAWPSDPLSQHGRNGRG